MSNHIRVLTTLLAATDKHQRKTLTAWCGRQVVDAGQRDFYIAGSGLNLENGIQIRDEGGLGIVCQRVVFIKYYCGKILEAFTKSAPQRYSGKQRGHYSCLNKFSSRVGHWILQFFGRGGRASIKNRRSVKFFAHGRNNYYQQLR